jgi:hypothetical protein
VEPVEHLSKKNLQVKPGLSGIAEYWSAKFEVIYLDGR